MDRGWGDLRGDTDYSVRSLSGSLASASTWLVPEDICSLYDWELTTRSGHIQELMYLQCPSGQHTCVGTYCPCLPAALSTPVDIRVSLDETHVTGSSLWTKGLLLQASGIRFWTE